jgi:pimeloyl-ACP methyl ester carboxylesterase
MPRPLVIIHGWSDTSASFQNLATLLRTRRGAEVTVISLADYVSMNDYVTFDDLVAAMDRAWTSHGLPRSAGAIDAIVHSTGGLVIRDWMSRIPVSKVPIKHLVMLAPANFGSPLAHKGRSFIGRVFKGYDNTEGAFQTGERILKGLELASPYSWNLAIRDRFGERAAMYGKGGVLCTVLVGNRGYDGIRAIANEDGSDGTVRVSTANLNCATLDLDFFNDPLKPTFEIALSGGIVGFAVMDGHHHGSITLSGSAAKSAQDAQLLIRINEALDVTDAGFAAWCQQLAAEADALMSDRASKSETQGFQNTVVHVIDQDGNPVTDYLVEFYEEDDDRNLIAKLFHTTALANVHAYGGDPSYRSLYVNCTRLFKLLDKMNEALRVSITAYPVIDQDGPVGFRTMNDTDIGSIKIPQRQLATIFRENRTVLVTITLRRERAERLFRFKNAP